MKFHTEDEQDPVDFGLCQVRYESPIRSIYTEEPERKKYVEGKRVIEEEWGHETGSLRFFMDLLSVIIILILSKIA